MFTEIVLGRTFVFTLTRVFLHVPSVLPALCVCAFQAFATIYFVAAWLIEIKLKRKKEKSVLQVKSKLCRTQQRQHL